MAAREVEPVTGSSEAPGDGDAETDADGVALGVGGAVGLADGVTLADGVGVGADTLGEGLGCRDHEGRGDGVQDWCWSPQ